MEAESRRRQIMNQNRTKLIKYRARERLEILTNETCQSVLWDLVAWILAGHIWKSIKREEFLAWRLLTRTNHDRRGQIKHHVQQKYSNSLLRKTFQHWNSQLQQYRLIKRVYFKWRFRAQRSKKFKSMMWNRLKLAHRVSLR
eukprot:UN26692